MGIGHREAAMIQNASGNEGSAANAAVASVAMAGARLPASAVLHLGTAYAITALANDRAVGGPVRMDRHLPRAQDADCGLRLHSRRRFLCGSVAALPTESHEHTIRISGAHKYIGSGPPH